MNYSSYKRIKVGQMSLQAEILLHMEMMSLQVLKVLFMEAWLWVLP